MASLGGKKAVPGDEWDEGDGVGWARRENRVAGRFGAFLAIFQDVKFGATTAGYCRSEKWHEFSWDFVQMADVPKKKPAKT